MCVCVRVRVCVCVCSLHKDADTRLKKELNHSAHFNLHYYQCVPSISLYFFDNNIFIDYRLSFSYDCIIMGSLYILVSEDGAHNRHVHRH